MVSRIFSWRTSTLIAAFAIAACGGATAPSPTTGSSGGTGQGGGSSGGGGSGGAVDSCSQSSDCAWGEIDHEILTATDCPCILGCPSLPLSKSTVDRRQAAYRALCSPNHDGHGNSCPIDDCIAPPPITCVDQKCVAPPTR